jgi:hypothetical protein
MLCWLKPVTNVDDGIADTNSTPCSRVSIRQIFLDHRSLVGEREDGDKNAIRVCCQLTVANLGMVDFAPAAHNSASEAHR